MRLQLDLGHSREHKFKHLQDSINPLCNCGRDIDSSFPPSLSLINERRFLSSTLNSRDCGSLDNTDTALTQALKVF